MRGFPTGGMRYDENGETQQGTGDGVRVYERGTYSTGRGTVHGDRALLVPRLVTVKGREEMSTISDYREALDNIPAAVAHAEQLNRVSPIVFAGVHGCSLAEYKEKMRDLAEYCETKIAELSEYEQRTGTVFLNIHPGNVAGVFHSRGQADRYAAQAGDRLHVVRLRVDETGQLLLTREDNRC